MLIAKQCPEPTVSTPSATSSVDNSNPKSQATPQLKAPGSSSFTPPCPSPPVAPPPSSASCTHPQVMKYQLPVCMCGKINRRICLFTCVMRGKTCLKKNPEIMELYGTKYQKICPTFFT